METAEHTKRQADTPARSLVPVFPITVENLQNNAQGRCTEVVSLSLRLA